MKTIINILLLNLIVLTSYSQVITTVIPTNAQQGQSLNVAISGNNLHFAQASNTVVWFDQASSTVVYPTSNNATSNNSLISSFIFPFNQNTGLYNLNVYNNIDGFLRLTNCFSIAANPNQPVLDSVNPNNGIQGQLLNINISGTNTHFSQATNTAVWFQQGSSTVMYPTNIQAINNTTISGSIQIQGNQPTGNYSLYVSNYIDGNLQLPNAFYINHNPNQPHLVSINPNNGTQGQFLNVNISGTNTHFSQASNTAVWFQQGSSTVMYPVNIQAVNDYTINASLQISSYQPQGYYNLYVNNSVDGFLSLLNSFYVNSNTYQPRILSVSPNIATQGEMLNISISGENTHFNQGSNTVTWFQQGSYKIYPNYQNSTSATNVNAYYTIPANANLGFYDTYTYNNSDGLLNLNYSFYIYPVAIYQIQAEANPTTGGYITGTGNYNSNQTCMLHAKCNPGYYFVNWTENGIYVSNDSIYSFTVYTNRILVANFSPINQYYITALVNPDFSGTVTGSGAYNFNQYATVHATPTLIWEFVNWTENGVIVSTDSIYTFQVTSNRTLVANFYQAISVSENINDNDIFIFPNPASKYLYIDTKNTSENITNLSIFDVFGKNIHFEKGNKTNPMKINISGFQKGIYYIKIKLNDDKTIVKKVLINN